MLGVGRSEPKQPKCENPRSSKSTTTTLGAWSPGWSGTGHDGVESASVRPMTPSKSPVALMTALPGSAPIAASSASLRACTRGTVASWVSTQKRPSTTASTTSSATSAGGMALVPIIASRFSIGMWAGAGSPRWAGALRVDSNTSVSTSSGHRQVTPTPVPVISVRRASLRPTTAYLVAW